MHNNKSIVPIKTSLGIYKHLYERGVGGGGGREQRIVRCICNCTRVNSFSFETKTKKKKRNYIERNKIFWSRNKGQGVIRANKRRREIFRRDRAGTRVGPRALKRPAPGELHLRVLVYKLKQDAAEYNSASNYPECFASFTETGPLRPAPVPCRPAGKSFVRSRGPTITERFDRAPAQIGRLHCDQLHK